MANALTFATPTLEGRSIISIHTQTLASIYRQMGCAISAMHGAL